MVKIICEGNSDKNKIGELLAFLDITKPNKPYDFNHDHFKILKDELISLFGNS